MASGIPPAKFRAAGQTESDSDDSGNERPVIRIVCPYGHRSGTMKLPGKKARCPQCYQNGRETRVTVPHLPACALDPDHAGPCR